jgi:hypothetical protein
VLDACNNKKQKFTHVMWLDSDATISCPGICIPSIFNVLGEEQRDIMVSGQRDGTIRFNAGAWMVKNTLETKQFLRDWLAKFPRDKWKYNFKTKKWKCKGMWSGYFYEQGSGLCVLRSRRHASRVAKLPYQVLNEDRFQYEPFGFVKHFFFDAKYQILNKKDSLL